MAQGGLSRSKESPTRSDALGNIFHHSVFSTEVVTKEGIHIQVTNTTANMRDGIITYEGNAIVTHQGVTFGADTIIENRQHGERSRVLAEGQPTVYVDELSTFGGISNGTATRVEYVADEGKVFLTDFVLYDSEGNSTSGEHGVYVLDES